MPRSTVRVVLVLLPIAFLHLVGCSQKLIPPTRDIPPETQLTYAPLETGTTSYRVHVYWYGYDDDGEVRDFRFAIDADTSKPATVWRVTTAHDSIFTFAVAPGDTIGAHAFWVAAEDNKGTIDPTPAKRRIAIRTAPPVTTITSGPANRASIGPISSFSWTGVDPDGSPTGGPALVDSFEFLLLQTGAAAESGHTPLPAYAGQGMDAYIQSYVDLINQARGPTLPAPYDDWKWVGTREMSHQFTNLTSRAIYVFAVRGVDGAGAHDSELGLLRNIRYFSIDPFTRVSDYAPVLTMASDLLARPIVMQADQFVGPAVTSMSLLQGDPVGFSWSAVPGADGSPIAGYAYALDDTTVASWTQPDPKNVSFTVPTGVSAGSHRLFVRAVDQAGGKSTIDLSLDVVPASFRNASSAFLYVDDFAPPPGTWPAALTGSPDFPTDAVEDDWWSRVVLAPIAQEFGMPWDQWDAVYLGYVRYGIGREAPTLRDLANYRVVIWSADLTNNYASPTGLWRTLLGNDWSALRAYIHGGGTLIVTAFNLASQTSSPTTTMYTTFTNGMCATTSPGNLSWTGAYFCRDEMGVDGALASNASSRNLGARDFVEARPTAQGSTLGFQMAEVDTGATGTGAKWNPYAFPGYVPDVTLAPGLPAVEGWKLETSLGCAPDESAFRRENPGSPIAVPIFTYHGVNRGVLQDIGPSPREGLVVGVATQAHDDGKGDGSAVTPANAAGVTGRMVFLGFPIYYVKDAEAYSIMRAAFAYVSASPTLLGAAP